MRIEFTPRARGHLTSIGEWIAADDPRASARVLARIQQTVLLLSRFPNVGRVGERGSMEFSVTGLPYVVVYRVRGDLLQVIGVFHTRRGRR